MGANSGKFYDVSKSNGLFSDVDVAFEAFNTNSLPHADSISCFSKSDSFKGQEANDAKALLTETEALLLTDILLLQGKISKLQQDMADRFKTDVDSAADARIEYDILESINNQFQDWYFDFNDNADSAESRANTVSSKYSKYGAITIPDFSSGKNSYIALCGGSITTSGYIFNCMEKLVAFDAAAMELINNSGVQKDILELSTRLGIDISKDTTTMSLACSTMNPLQFSFMQQQAVNQLTFMIIEKILGDVFKDVFDFGSSLWDNVTSWWDSFVEDFEQIDWDGIFTYGPILYMHYNRNELNYTPSTYKEICEVHYDEHGEPIITELNGWVLLPDKMADYHRLTMGEQGAEAVYNKKFLYYNDDGSSYEVIICIPPENYGKDPEIVHDPYNAGTYNVVSPAPPGSNPLEIGITYFGHFVFDMIPYWNHGNSEADSGIEMLPYRILGPDRVQTITETADEAFDQIKRSIEIVTKYNSNGLIFNR